MRKELFTVLVLLPLAGCDDSSKLAGNTATKTEGNADYNSNESNAPEQTPESPVAFTPVPVAGAYLNCSYVESAQEEIRCVALNDFGAPKAFEAKIAYIISGEGDAWVESTFEENGVGSWIVRKPAALKPNFAVVLVDDTSGVLADWIVDEDNLPKMMLVDGSFEDLVVDVSSDETRRATQFLGPESQKT